MFVCLLFRWGLTALNFHYESQCIPTPLAWYAHQLPEWFQKLSVVGTYFIEIGVPFLFFAPVRSLRMFAFWCQVSMFSTSTRKGGVVVICCMGNFLYVHVYALASLSLDFIELEVFDKFVYHFFST